MSIAVACAALLAASAAAQTRVPLDEPHAHALVEAVVRVHAHALPDARSNDALGSERTGSGVVIDERDHVLTVGYLVIEAQDVELTTSDNRTVPARVLAYDQPTGLALLEALAPLGVKPIALGSSDTLKPNDLLMTLTSDGPKGAALTRLVIKRQFTANWEYLLDEALFVAPPVDAWAGAALINRDLELVGIGSLLVRDVDPEGQNEAEPGNMFVPIDLVKPVLADLIAQGQRKGPPRPWLGLATAEVSGYLIVTRVSSDSPADRAGVQRGDLVLAVGDKPVTSRAQLYQTVWGLGAAGVEVPLTLLRGAQVVDLTLKSIDRATYFRQQARQ
ncbi:MAG: S1C family serine protease [Gemmatimonadota bacterium]